MRKIFIIIFVLSSTLAFSQKEAKNKIVDFNPAFRFGFQLPIQFGNNYFSKDLSSGFGFHSTLSLVKIYNFRLSLGYEFQKLKVENSNAIGNFDYINSNSYQYILEYEIPLNSKLELNPTISYGQCQFNYKENTGGSILAKQSLEEIRLGSYINYNLNKTAVKAHVKDLARFHNAGYKGLYNGETADDIFKRKKLRYREDILDNMGSEELANNIFRIAQTDAKLKRDNVDNEYTANSVHYEVGKEVRNSIKRLGGTMPEDLPTPNKSLKEIEKENCFVVSLKNKDTNEIEKELATSKKNAKISEVHHTTATTGKIKK